jgi:hypothetical protein
MTTPVDRPWEKAADAEYAAANLMRSDPNLPAVPA